MPTTAIQSREMSEHDVLALAERVFGSREKALLWLESADDRLTGQPPISAMGSASGVQQVTSLLWGLDEGVHTYCSLSVGIT